MENSMIKPLKITRTFYYFPEYYLEFCQESDSIPTQEEFLEYTKDQILDDFESNLETFSHLTIEYLEV